MDCAQRPIKRKCSDGEGFTSECGLDERGSTQKAKTEEEYKVI
jgi:hypothetical protein